MQWGPAHARESHCVCNCKAQPWSRYRLLILTPQIDFCLINTSVFFYSIYKLCQIYAIEHIFCLILFRIQKCLGFLQVPLCTKWSIISKFLNGICYLHVWMNWRKFCRHMHNKLISKFSFNSDVAFVSYRHYVLYHTVA